MDRQALAAKYQKLFELAREKTADWYVYGHAAELLRGQADVMWVRQELERALDQCLRHAEEHGSSPDSDYGTYGCYMSTKAQLYRGVLAESAVMVGKTWQEALDERREIDGLDEYALLFHGDHPAAHILVGPELGDEIECEVGRNPKEWIPVDFDELEPTLVRLGIALDGWE